MATDAPDDDLDTVLARVRAAAPRRDLANEGLDAELGWLRAAGLLVAAMPANLSGLRGWSDDPRAIYALLRRIGAASLPLGRLFEGHINAAQLIGLYAGETAKRQFAAAVRSGAFLGVWGADGTEPVSAQQHGEGFILHGDKAFCSGLGLVDLAVISARIDAATRLFLVDVRDVARADATQWQVSGMRATKSGGYDFEGLVLPADAALGGPDDFFVEPWFLGGMYRFCAVQVGGLDELLDEVARALRCRHGADSELAQLRLGQMASLRALAAEVTRAAAAALADGTPPAELARDAILMREGVEHCVVAIVEIAERALGTLAHRDDSIVSRLRRDLLLYIRQAAVDARLIAVGRWYLGAEN